MSFNIPNTFVAGTKAKADEVNENFTVVCEEITRGNKIAAELKEEFDYIKNDLVDEFLAENELMMKSIKSKFCVNYANVDSTGKKTDIFSADGAVLSFKVGGDYPYLTGTNAYGDSETFENIDDYDVSSKVDGSYYVFLNLAGTIELQNKRILKGTLEPAGVETGDIWLMTLEPWSCYLFNGISWNDYESIPLGRITVENGQIISFENNFLNTQYLDSDCNFLTQNARKNLSKRYETPWFNVQAGGVYSFDHNLNHDPLHYRARLVARVKAPVSGFNQGDIVETLYSNYGGNVSSEAGYILKYNQTNITLSSGSNPNHCFNNLSGGTGALAKADVELKIIVTQDVN